MKVSSPLDRRPSGLRRTRAAWAGAVVALSCALPIAVHTSADASPRVAARDGSVCSASNATPTTNPSTSPSPTTNPSASPSPTTNPSTNPSTNPGTSPGYGHSATIRITQANMKSGLDRWKFKSDLSRAYAKSPDFITFNEVPFRPDNLLARPGYALYRTPGRYTGASPVVWNAAKWTAIARGTTMISNTPGTVGSQTSEWGIRYANWVTVRSLDGSQTVSMVATHLAPINRITKNLMGPSIRRLGALVSGLSAYGPVFVGGDFNRHYTAQNFPREGLTAAGLTPAYDLAGCYLPTGENHDPPATIDYVMLRPAPLFSVLSITTTDMYSDHEALSVVLSMPSTTRGERPIAFAPGTSVNDPASSSGSARRALLRTIRNAINNTTDGAQLRLSTAQLADRGVTVALRRAFKRGVDVKVISGSATATRLETSLQTLLGSRRSASSWIRFNPGQATRRLATSTLLADRTGSTTYLVLTANRAFDSSLVTEPAQATMATSSHTGFKNKVRAFGALVRSSRR